MSQKVSKTKSPIVISKLNELQQKLKAPKNRWNNFGQYSYRSCEDILEAVKPLLGDFIIKLDDEIIERAGKNYVKAKAVLISPNDGSISTTAYAREPESKKGVDSSQITGIASSYARKYALNGLLAIDDEKDADTRDNRNEGRAQQESGSEKKEYKEYPKSDKPPTPGQKKYINDLMEKTATSQIEIDEKFGTVTISDVAEVLKYLQSKVK